MFFSFCSEFHHDLINFPIVNENNQPHSTSQNSWRSKKEPKKSFDPLKWLFIGILVVVPIMTFCELLKSFLHLTMEKPRSLDGVSFLHH